MAFINVTENYLVVTVKDHLTCVKLTNEKEHEPEVWRMKYRGEKEPDGSLTCRAENDVFYGYSPASVLATDANEDRLSTTLAVCDDAKYFYLWDLAERKLILTRNLRKQATRVKILSRFKKAVVADRTGEVTEFDLVTGDSRVLLGHLSMLLDVAEVSLPNKTLLATCDRDRRIRVSRYPETYFIETFCMGHVRYVNCLAVLEDESGAAGDHSASLVSCSGDGTLRTWDCLSGKCLSRFNYLDVLKKKYLNATEDGVKSVASSGTTLALCFQRCSVVLVLWFDASMWNVARHEVVSFDSVVVLNLCFRNVSRGEASCLFVLCADAAQPVRCYQVSRDDCQPTEKYEQAICAVTSLPALASDLLDVGGDEAFPLLKLLKTAEAEKHCRMHTISAASD